MAEGADRRVAVVTGAAQGLGRAVARRLGRDGFRVIVNDLADDDRLSGLATELDGTAIAGDVADGETVVSLVRAAGGAIDTLVANHAAMAMAPFVEQDPSVWWHQLEVNLSATFRLVQAALPGMRAAGHGRIVIVASEAGVIGMRNASGYAASKAGLITLTKSLGRELAREGIVVNAVAPSYIDTPQLAVDAADAGLTLDQLRQRAAAGIPVGRLARPEEIAATIAFLAGPGAGSFIGQVLQPNGGTTRTRA